MQNGLAPSTVMYNLLDIVARRLPLLYEGSSPTTQTSQAYIDCLARFMPDTDLAPVQAVLDAAASRAVATRCTLPSDDWAPRILAGGCSRFWGEWGCLY